MFKSTLVFVLLISTVFGGTLQSPDFTGWEGRIVGGSTANPGQFSFIASLRTLSNFHFCGGSIINSRWVLSAAHCTISQIPANVQIVVGAHSISSDGTRLACSRIVNNPIYNRFTLANDISLLQTATEILFNQRVSFIPLGASETPGGILSTSIGWGQTSHPGSAAQFLQFVDKPTISNADCTRSWGSRITSGHICTFFGVGVGTCMGDSGGPLIADGQLIGAVSFGSPCARGMPDVFTRVSSYLGWISSTLAS